MKNIVYVFLVFFLGACKSKSKAQELLVQADEVTKIISYLASDELQGRDTGSEGLDKAAAFIEKEFMAAGVRPYFKGFRDVFEVKGINTYNVVGWVEGNDPMLKKEFVIVGAHLDHIGLVKGTGVKADTIANGANDNAAGSTAVITLAKQFAASKRNKRSILFVLFGAEERGLLGSNHLAKVLKKQNLDLYTMVNFEMIGVPLKDKSYKAYLTGYEMSNMAEKINEYAGKELIGFLPKAKEFQLFRRSDNYPFYKKFSVPCQTISTFDFTNYEYYHHVDDEVAYIDIGFMTELINDCKPVLEEIVNADVKEIKLKN